MRKLFPLLVAFILAASACSSVGTVPVGKRFLGKMKKERAMKAVGLTSASTDPSAYMENDKSKTFYVDRFQAAMRVMAGDLVAGLDPKTVPHKTKVAVTSYVSVGNYETAEPFGNLCAQQMLVTLAEQRFKVQEIKKTPGILVHDDNGFFVLSDRVAKMSDMVKTDLVLAGTYAMVNGELLVNAVLLRADSSEVVSTATITMDVQTDSFLRPLMSQLRRGSGNPITAQSLMIREPAIRNIDTPARYLSLKIDKLSRDLLKNMKVDGMGKVVIVSTFVDFDRFYTTHMFGRYLTEQLMQKMSERNFKVVEVRAAKELMIQPNVGEVALSRDIGEMMNKYEADLMVLGTYRKTGDSVVVHARMIVSNNQEVVSHATMDMDVDKNDTFINAMFEKPVDRVGQKSTMEGF